jgi:CDP-diacylglycerol--serine O-phosphatidyltransferase
LSQSTYKRFSLADGISLLNAVFGFLAIIMIVLNQLDNSFRLILLALLTDGLDGIVARKTGQSNIGESLDSMADMISLILAPALFVYGTYSSIVNQQMQGHLLLLGVLIVYISCGLVRLASFHHMKKEYWFVGLPASTSALIIMILSLFTIPYGYICIVVVVLSLAMISSFRFPKSSLLIDGIAGVLIVITLIFGTRYHAVVPFLLLVALTVYVIGGPLYLLKKYPKRKKGKNERNEKKTQ